MATPLHLPPHFRRLVHRFGPWPKTGSVQFRDDVVHDAFGIEVRSRDVSNGLVWRFISGMLTDQATAEDVLQTVWMRVVRSMTRLREPQRLAAWLYRIARLAVADRLRGQYRRPATYQVEEVSETDEGIELVDIADTIESGLAHLHPTDREAVVLHYLEQRPIGEVAEICGVPPGTIKSRLYRARRIVREKLVNES